MSSWRKRHCCHACGKITVHVVRRVRRFSDGKLVCPDCYDPAREDRERQAAVEAIRRLASGSRG